MKHSKMLSIFIKWFKNLYHKLYPTNVDINEIKETDPLIKPSMKKKNYSGIFISTHEHNINRDAMTDDEHTYFLNDVDL